MHHLPKASLHLVALPLRFRILALPLEALTLRPDALPGHFCPGFSSL